MTTNNKFFNNLGLAMRAGKVITGEDMVIESVRHGEAKLVIIAEDASAGTYKKVNDKCSYYQVPLHQFGRREQLGASIGKEARVVLAVTDAGFARMLLKQ
ncbi:YlxQ family RNA-binding protein [Paenibacillus mucilaginosus]|uniref:RplGA n=3 Tax=Paenibacillus mucilaginosus TaxID=61624 RepID=H6NPC7_9BACL|nr:YlxQ family RNA-binding protein [Paenibacillus mucilaginosus]AEI44296.1 RplGA [Paenibacillus mucilaginosus KNP414]AFC31837.1 RplGA [Paenibacillus mucilaginosus 3016]MCG7217649.1 YlxQ family RNA-binding protein [Paenibacillus mucilaginosus]WDM25694.1 YlxQ family RNA-binding protein [Paenibacillus mucilaginosus]WFA20350.1 YlxQ family RNA-binding protein [Paenibacillus mucilaginosus]